MFVSEMKYDDADDIMLVFFYFLSSIDLHKNFNDNRNRPMHEQC